MFVAGQIIYFQPFHFKNGDEPKNKYFLVLKNIDEITIVASLPTSINNAPSLIDKSHGCINIDERRFNCYVFEKDKCVCDNGFYFDLHTYVYGNQVNNYEKASISKNDTIKDGVDYKLQGVLTQQEFNDVYQCIVNSDSTIGRIKKLLK